VSGEPGDAHWALEQIALEVGHDRGTISKVLRRVEEQTLAECTVTSGRAWELARLDTILDRLWPLLDPDDPDATPDLDAVVAFLAISKRRAALVGLNVRPAHTLRIESRVRIDGGYGAGRAERLERTLDLLDKVTTAGIGSGRAIEVEGDAEDDTGC
jgi:hypothetical protein